MSENDDDRFWAEIGKAASPRRSSFEWEAQRARVVSRLIQSQRPLVRPWFAAVTAAALAGGLLILNGGEIMKFLGPERSVAVAVWDARLTTVDGLVTVVPKDETYPVPAVVGMPLSAGDRILTGEGAHAEVALAAESLIELGPDAVLTVSDIHEKHTFLDLDAGSFVAKFHWDKALGRELEVRTPTTVAAVRGTEFGLTVAPDGETAVAVFDEGRVAVRAKDAPAVAETMLEAHQETIVTRGLPTTDAREGRNYLRVEPLRRMEPYHERVALMRAREHELISTWRRMPEAQRLSERARLTAPERQIENGHSSTAPRDLGPRMPGVPRAFNPNPAHPRVQTPQRTENRTPSQPRGQAQPRSSERPRTQPRPDSQPNTRPPSDHREEHRKERRREEGTNRERGAPPPRR
ncbi:MAG: FecR domain-containing protein [Elusimicrobiota bacterium]